MAKKKHKLKSATGLRTQRGVENTRIVRDALRRAAGRLKKMSDGEVATALGTGALDAFLRSILDPTALRGNDRSIYENLLANKFRATVIARLRLALTRNYSVEGRIENGTTVYVSPIDFQWHKGVMFVQGDERFRGIFGLYEDGEVRFGVAARKIAPGERIGPKDIAFIPVDQVNERSRALAATPKSRLEAAVETLERQLNDADNEEKTYQRILEENPWMLGGEYSVVQPHRHLDERNLPDFAGVKIHDNSRDIIEIKAPFLKLFNQDGEFSADFNAAWNQAERYLAFVRQERDYLSRKGLSFINPKCWLLIGRGLTAQERERIAAKERFVPAIRVLTYDDLVKFARHTIKFAKERVAELATETPGAEPPIEAAPTPEPMVENPEAADAVTRPS